MTERCPHGYSNVARLSSGRWACAPTLFNAAQEVKVRPVHWHELPEFVVARAHDKGIDLGGDGHRHRLVTRRDANGGPAMRMQQTAVTVYGEDPS